MRVLALVKDLMFRSKIDAVCESMAIEVVYVSAFELLPGRCSEILPSVVVVDLSEKAFPPEPVMAELRKCVPEARVIGFASHVDLKALSGARQAGFGRVLSRQEFAAQLPALLRSEQK